MIEFIAIKKDKIEDIWDDIEPIIEKVMDYNWGFYSIEDVKGSLVSGECLLLCVVENGEYLACITCVQEPHPTKKVLHMPVVAGERMAEWIDEAFKVIPQLAKDLGFDMLMSKGRKGWNKVLGSRGFKEMHTVLGMEL